MFEKNLKIGYLLDFYGDILPERKREVLDYYYNDDLSLSEISSEIGISRQGVRDMIKKSEEVLLFYEEKLGLAQKFTDTAAAAQSLADAAEKYELPSEVKEKILSLIVTVNSK